MGNLALKYSPFKFNLQPYAVLGAKADYVLKTQSENLVIKEGYSIVSEALLMEINSFNKYRFGAIIALGLEYKDRVFLEFEYNPAFLSNKNSGDLPIGPDIVRSRFYGLSVGLNIFKTSDNTNTSNTLK